MYLQECCPSIPSKENNGHCVLAVALYIGAIRVLHSNIQGESGCDRPAPPKYLDHTGGIRLSGALVHATHTALG
ncbi:hypothetical protein EVAR_16546_1 [Eumeta japonica]|uniref:Uncharacterized protein n=1 Tax=Eumeta variegata TaxID=151549 RepID=A0A4C1U2S3_EUMVA|nr:hypothetical protein EVAR_16546_1 [Eumeta japonica]